MTNANDVDGGWHVEEVVRFDNNTRTVDGWEVRQLSEDGLEDSFIAFCITEERAEQIAANHQAASRVPALERALQEAEADASALASRLAIADRLRVLAREALASINSKEAGEQ